MMPEHDIPERNSGFPIQRRSGREILEIDVDLYCRGRGMMGRYTDGGLIKARVVEGKTYAQLAKETGITLERVRQRICKALNEAESAQVLHTGVIRR